MKVTGGSLTPRQAWAMSLTEALGMCLGAASLAKQGQSRRAEAKPYEERADGTRSYRIDSMEKLHGFLANGRV